MRPFAVLGAGPDTAEMATPEVRFPKQACSLASCVRCQKQKMGGQGDSRLIESRTKFQQVQ